MSTGEDASSLSEPASALQAEMTQLEELDALPGVRIDDSIEIEVVITEGLNEQFLFAQADYHERYVGDGQGRRGMVHPGLLVHLNAPGFRVGPNSGWSGVAGRDAVEFISPVFVGEHLIVTWTVVDFFERRGRPWWV